MKKNVLIMKWLSLVVKEQKYYASVKKTFVNEERGGGGGGQHQQLVHKIFSLLYLDDGDVPVGEGVFVVVVVEEEEGVDWQVKGDGIKNVGTTRTERQIRAD